MNTEYDRFEDTDRQQPTTTSNLPALRPVKKHHPGARIAAIALSAALLCGGASYGGCALYDVLHPETPTADVQIPEAAPEADFMASTKQQSTADTAAGALYQAQLPSCVGITVSTTQNIFGRTTSSACSGSGFILTADGYIVTNYHVIETAAENGSASEIKVTLADGTEYDATLVGGESSNDVAVLKVDATNLQPVTLGDSDSLEVGDTVYTIGNPLGELTFSLTDGLVSALSREIDTGSGPMNMLQTNCAINPGNSGGPLFDAAGRVVGIVTAKVTQTSSGVGTEGLGFAIPIQDVKAMLDDIMQYGYVTGKPWLGITASTVSSIYQRYGIPAGAAVESVVPDSCAEKAGLKVNDIITAVDGTAIDSSSALSQLLASQYHAGDTITLTVVYDGDTRSVTVTLDEKTNESEAAAEESQQQADPWQNYGGNGNSGTDPWSGYGWRA